MNPNENSIMCHINLGLYVGSIPRNRHILEMHPSDSGLENSMVMSI